METLIPFVTQDFACNLYSLFESFFNGAENRRLKQNMTGPRFTSYARNAFVKYDTSKLAGICCKKPILYYYFSKFMNRVPYFSTNSHFVNLVLKMPFWINL